MAANQPTVDKLPILIQNLQNQVQALSAATTAPYIHMAIHYMGMCLNTLYISEMEVQSSLKLEFMTVNIKLTVRNPSLLLDRLGRTSLKLFLIYDCQY